LKRKRNTLFYGGLLAVLAIGFAVRIGSGCSRMNDTTNELRSLVLERATANAELVRELETPIEIGALDEWNMTTSHGIEPEAQAKASALISGPKTKGKLRVVAQKNKGVWSFSTLTVELPGRAPVDLTRSP
jgi:hypothetical protein